MRRSDTFRGDSRANRDDGTMGQEGERAMDLIEKEMGIIGGGERGRR